jgi:hypothetical protein
MFYCDNYDLDEAKNKIKSGDAAMDFVRRIGADILVVLFLPTRNWKYSSL